MAYKLTRNAQHALMQIQQYTLENHGSLQAAEYLDKLADTMEMLGNHPHPGASRDDVRPGLCSFPCESHVNYFRPASHGVNIVTLLHERQDPARNL